MTTTDLAAAILRDVPTRYQPVNGDRLLHESDVLAALTAAMDPALSERAGEVQKDLKLFRAVWGELPSVAPHIATAPGVTTGSVISACDRAASLITALLAQIAALRAERDEAHKHELEQVRINAENVEALIAAEAERDALRTERDRRAEMHECAMSERDDATLYADEQRARAEAAEAKVKKLRAERDDALTFLDNAVAKAPEPLKALGKYLAGRLDEDEWPTAEQHLNAAAKACADRTTAAEAQIAALAARVERAGEVLEGVTQGRVVQFHPHFCEEAEGTPFTEWDTSHDLSVIRPDGERYRIGSMRHADDAAFFQWCHANLPTLLAQNAALRAERDELSSKLEVERALTDAVHRLAKAAEAQNAALTARVERLTGAVKGLVEILDRHETKGPLPDVALMLCWLAAQDVRAVMREIGGQ